MLNNNTPYEPERVGGTEIWITKDLIRRRKPKEGNCIMCCI